MRDSESGQAVRREGQGSVGDIYFCFKNKQGAVGVAMVLGKLPMPGRPTIWIQ